MFFPSWKTVFKLSRHLLDTSSTPGYLSSFQNFSYRNLNRSSTARWTNRESSWTLDSFLITSGSIELLFCFFASFLDTSSTAASVDVVFLDTFLNRWLDTSRHLYLLRITETLYIRLSRFGSHFLDLSRSIRSYSPPKHFLLPLNLQPTWFSAFPCFKSLGMCSFSLILHAFHAFRPRFWGFFKFFWGFSKLMSYC